jgi:HD-GYP domain-containing protein (c-di-GMP phosphodiesterase class II)
MLAEAMGIALADVVRISLGGFLHDLGKIGISDAVLRKASALDEQECALIRTHPEMGARMLAGHPLADPVSEAAYSHHERLMAKAIPVV